MTTHYHTTDWADAKGQEIEVELTIDFTPGEKARINYRDDDHPGSDPSADLVSAMATVHGLGKVIDVTDICAQMYSRDDLLEFIEGDLECAEFDKGDHEYECWCDVRIDARWDAEQAA